MHYFEVGLLAVSAKIIDFAVLSGYGGAQDAAAVVVDVNPVAHVGAGAVDGQLLVLQHIVYHQRYELFGELPGAVVVAAARYYCRQGVGVGIGHGHKVGRCLGRRIWRRRPQRRQLAETAAAIKHGGAAQQTFGLCVGSHSVGTVDIEVAVNLVGAHLHKAVKGAVAARALQKGLSAGDVRGYERRRVVDAAVHVRLGGEIHNYIRLEALQRRCNCIGVDYRGGNDIIRRHYSLEIGRIAGIGKRIENTEGYAAVAQQSHEGRPYETGASAHKNSVMAQFTHRRQRL